MEKTDLVIALAGAAVLVVAITASALTGGTAVGAEFSVTFPTSDTALPAQTFQTQGSGDRELTFEVPVGNVTTGTFTVTAAGPANAAAPTISITVTTPSGDEFQVQGATIEVPVSTAPAPFDTRAANAAAVVLPAANATGTGTWTVLVQIGSPAPLPVPYTVSVEGAITSYAGTVAPKVPLTPR